MGNPNGSGRNGSVMSVGAIARVAKVAPRTVAKWIDSGQLRGYRLPGTGGRGPGTCPRRVERAEVVRFLTAHGMPLGDLDAGASVLAVGLDPAAAGRLAGELGGGLRLDLAADAFAAGREVARLAPAVVLIDHAGVGGEAGRAIAAAVTGTPVVALLPEDAGPESAPDARVAVQHPFDPAAVAAAVAVLAAERPPVVTVRCPMPVARKAVAL